VDEATPLKFALVKLAPYELEIASVEESPSSCTFYDAPSGTWKTDGCSVAEEQASYYVCACTHLTSFQAATDKEKVDAIGVPT